MLGLFDNLRNSRTVEFNLVEKEDGTKAKVRVCLNHVSREDGSGNSFCFEGFVPEQSMTHAKGWMSTTSRKGWLHVTTGRD